MRRALLPLALALLLAAPAAARTREDGLRSFLRSAFAEAGADFGDSSYVAAFADLDGDGREEALVSLSSGYFCGSGGCALYIYTRAGDSWRQVAELTISNPPVRLLTTRSRGWRDLAVQVRGGGFERPREALIRFDGRTYASNPSLAPRARGRTAGRVLISGNEEGQRLF